MTQETNETTFSPDPGAAEAEGHSAVVSKAEVGGSGTVARGSYDANGSPVEGPPALPRPSSDVHDRRAQLIAHAAGAPTNEQYKQELADLVSRYDWS